MIFRWSEPKEIGGYLFRVRDIAADWHKPHQRFEAEAKRASEPFECDSVLGEPWHHDVWFEYGPTAEDALRRLKAELLN